MRALVIVFGCLLLGLPACRSFGVPSEAELAEMRVIAGSWSSIRLESDLYQGAGISSIDLLLDAETRTYRWTNFRAGEGEVIEGEYRVSGSWLLLGASPGRSEGRMRYLISDGRLVLDDAHSDLLLELVRR